MISLRSALGARQPAKEVVVDGVRLTYDDEGSGPPLLCLHSIAHGARDFEGLRARFRDRCRVLALDWPGHGSSSEDVAPAGAARYAALLAGFAEALDLRDLVILGNSIGGAAAIRFAAEHPERVRALVLVDAGGLVPVHAFTRAVTRGMAAFFAAGARGARWFPPAYALYYRLVLPAAPARAWRERIAAAGREMAPRLAEAWRSFGEPDADTRALATGLTCPVFVAWAKRDRVLPLALNRAAIRRIPGALLEVFPGGHAPFLECPDAFFAALERFLARLEPGPG